MLFIINIDRLWIDSCSLLFLQICFFHVGCCVFGMAMWLVEYCYCWYVVCNWMGSGFGVCSLGVLYVADGVVLLMGGVHFTFL